MNNSRNKAQLLKIRCKKMFHIQTKYSKFAVNYGRHTARRN